MPFLPFPSLLLRRLNVAFQMRLLSIRWRMHRVTTCGVWQGLKGEGCSEIQCRVGAGYEAKISVVTIELGGEELSSYLR